MGAATPPPTPSPSAAAGTDASPGTGARPPINGNTQGVIGIPELKLAANAQNAALGSVMSSGKGNVKLESGTLMLLRVNP
jgi:subtilase family serine protease